MKRLLNVKIKLSYGSMLESILLKAPNPQKMVKNNLTPYFTVMNFL